MTAYIERIVTEVVVTPEQESSDQQSDSRWLEQQKFQAHLKMQQVRVDRTKAEGLDD